MWSEVKQVLSRMMSSLAFETWIEGTTATMEEHTVTIHCTNPMQKVGLKRCICLTLNKRSKRFAENGWLSS